jgi:hypothetical protein
MKSQRIFGSIAALGLAVSGITSAMMMGASKAIADDDWPASNDRPAWSQRCDRDWDNEYCNPKINSSRDGQWSDQEQWQNQDQGVRNRDWERAQNQGQNPWGNEDQGQWQNQDRFFRNRLSAGTTISAYPERRQRIVLRRSERYPLTLVVSEDVGSLRPRSGRAVLPRGSRVEGELVPTRNGYRFESRQVRLPNGRSRQIWATSNTIRPNSSLDRYDRNLDGASSGAQSILNAILGRSNSSGSVYSGDVFERYPNSRRDLVVIYPDQTLELRLTREFVRDQRNF